MPRIKCCAACKDKLERVRITGRSEPAYILEELQEEPKPGPCPLCFATAHLSLYELTRRQLRYSRRSGGGEREKAGGAR